MRKKVFVTRKIPYEGIQILTKFFDVEIFPENRPISKEEILSGAKGCDGLLPLLTDKIDAEIMDATGIKAIANMAVGYDNIDVKAATERKLPICNTPGVLTDATADLTLTLILSLSRRIVEADKYLREGKFVGWDPMLCLGGDFKDKILGIIGFGRIGKAVARRAYGFGMTILYHSRARYEKEENELGVKYASLEELLEKSDYVSIHTPHTSDTHHLIGENELKKMKPTSYLVNTSRGKIIEEDKLVSALKDGEIAGAGLDVYYNEPVVHPGLIELPNVILLPHIGSASLGTRTKMATMAANNLKDALLGKIPKNIVNPEIYQ